MSDIDIDKLDGRELDRRVARYVFGWNVAIGDFDPGKTKWEKWTDESGNNMDVVSFSADPAAMMLVVERMRELGRAWTVHHYPQNEAFVSFDAAQAHCANGGYAYGRTVATAVARAALRAVERERLEVKA